MTTPPSVSKILIPVCIGGAILLAVGTFVLWDRGGQSFIPSASAATLEPGKHRKITDSMPLKFTLPVEMKKEGFEKSFVAPPDLPGAGTWEGDLFVYKPSTKPEIGKTYTFIVDGAAARADGSPLGEILEYSVTVAGAPAVSTIIPAADSTDVPVDATFVIVFDRPMVPLAFLADRREFESGDAWPVTITPTPKGRWRWISTTTAEFTPEEDLILATTYQVRVPAGVVDIFGAPLDQEKAWSFSTLQPKVESMDPATGYQLAGPGTELSVTFNQPISLESARAIQLLEGDTTVIPVALSRGQKDEDGKKVTDENTVILKPSKPLVFNTSYSIVVPAGVRGKQGDLGTVEEVRSAFSTVGDFAVQTPSYSYGSIQMYFSSPVDEKTLTGSISIHPPVEGWDTMDLQSGLWDDNTQISFYPGLAPSTEYTITIGTEKLVDRFGQHLKVPFTFTFTTEPLPPRIFIHSKGQFGIFEAGKPPIYYVNGVNISKMDLALIPLTPKEFFEIRRNKEQDNEYAIPVAKFNGYKAWELQTEKKQDIWEAIPVDLAEEFGATLKPGIYAFTAQSPEYKKDWGDYGPIIEEQYFAITNMAITLKYSGTKALVWVVDMRTGEPVSGADIGFHSLNGKIPVNGVTGKDGFFEADLPLKEFDAGNNYWMPEFWVTASKAGDLAFVASNWNDGISPYNFSLSEDFLDAQRPRLKADIYLQTDRPIYRPGDEVHFKGIMRYRNPDGEFELPPKGTDAAVVLYDAEGTEVYRKLLDTNDYGSFSDTFPVGEDASLGMYSLNVEQGGTAEGYAAHTFSVIAYRKPEYNVSVAFPQPDYFDDDQVAAMINGAYYFGAPMDGSTVRWRVYSTDYFFNKVTDGWYSFSDEGWCYYGCERETNLVTEGTGKLDATGKLPIGFPMDITGKKLSQVVTVEADITDANNQVVSSRESIIVHQADGYVGIRSDDYVLQPGDTAKASVIVVKPDGSPMPGARVKVELYSRVWNTIRKKGVDGEYYYESEAKDTFIRDTSVTTGSDGKAIAEIPVKEGGQYHIVAHYTDSAGRETKAGTDVYVTSETYINWPHTNSDRLEVIADKPSYTVGDTAVLLVKSPYQGKGVKALVTVEREQILSRKVIDITSTAQSIEVPITEDFIPNAYVSVVIVKPRMGETFNEFGLDTGTPAFKIGYVKLPVDIRKKELTVTITADKEKYLPGEEVTVMLQTDDASGRNVSGEVSLSVVDMSVLALTGFEMPRPVSFFYSERGLGVRTAQMLLYVLERFKPGSKGGGGADPATRARGNFKDTAYWDPSIVTDEAGRATIKFKLPDNLTAWKLVAIAQTKEHTFGAAAEEILETKKVIVRPVRPRFAVKGDEIELGAIVHNFLDQDASFTVSLKGSGFTPMDDATQTVTIKAGEEMKLAFPVTVTSSEKIVLNFTAETDGARDEIEETIPGFLFGIPQTMATSGIIEGTGGNEKVIIPSEEDVTDLSLTASLSPSLGVYLPEGLEFVTKFPYGCAEQTVSSLLPNIAISDLQGFDAFSILSQKELDARVLTGLQTLYAYQLSDGGFTYFRGENARSYPYLTAYVLYALQKADKSGYAVDADSMGRARSYLKDSLRTLNTDKELDLATRAYILYVLAEGGAADQSLLENLRTKKDKLPLFAQAQLAMAYQYVSVPKAKEILTDILNHAKVDPRGTHFEEDNNDRWGSLMHTNTRTTALVLQAAVRQDPENVLIPRIVRWLLAVREDGHWDTTQSTAQTIFAFVDYLENTGELSGSFKTTMAVNGSEVGAASFGKGTMLTKEDISVPLEKLVRDETNDVAFTKDGEGRLYYDLLLSGEITPDAIPAEEEGISIQRDIQSLTDDVILSPSKGDTFKTTGTYKVTLTITAPEERHFVAVESPLPAGFEAIDLSMKTSQQNLYEGEVNEQEEPQNWWDWWMSNLWYFTHIEFRDDRVFLFAEELPAGVYKYEYLVRATVPGKFQQRPARAWEFYFPEVFGQTEGGWVEIKE